MKGVALILSVWNHLEALLKHRFLVSTNRGSGVVPLNFEFLGSPQMIMLVQGPHSEYHWFSQLPKVTLLVSGNLRFEPSSDSKLRTFSAHHF